MKDDIDFIVRFIELIEQKPCLYDSSRRDYCNRTVQERAWHNIAENVHEPVNECKDRWKNIRGRYLKFIKSRTLPPGSTAKPQKEYYLADNLRFLDSFLKPRNKKALTAPSLQSEPAYFTEDDNDPLECLLDSPDSPDTRFTVPPGPDESKPTTSQPGTQYFEEKLKIQNSTDDADLSFFKSLLPDMNLMSSEQKRRFKIGILTLSGHILEENKSDTISPI